MPQDNSDLIKTTKSGYHTYRRGQVDLLDVFILQNTEFDYYNTGAITNYNPLMIIEIK